MTAHTIDTAAAIRKLTTAGLSAGQAEAIAEIIDSAGGSYSTKSDLDALEARLTAKIVTAQVLTATLLFTAIRFFA